MLFFSGKKTSFVRLYGKELLVMFGKKIVRMITLALSSCWKRENPVWRSKQCQKKEIIARNKLSSKHLVTSYTRQRKLSL